MVDATVDRYEQLSIMIIIGDAPGRRIAGSFVLLGVRVEVGDLRGMGHLEEPDGSAHGNVEFAQIVERIVLFDEVGRFFGQLSQRLAPCSQLFEPHILLLRLVGCCLQCRHGKLMPKRYLR